MHVEACDSATSYLLHPLTARNLPQMLAGGVIFGWQALLPVLYDYGVFAESCKGSTEAYPCLKMRSKLALVFSIAVINPVSMTTLSQHLQWHF